MMDFERPASHEGRSFDNVSSAKTSKRAAAAKLIGNSLRHYQYWDVIPPPGFPKVTTAKMIRTVYNAVRV